MQNNRVSIIPVPFPLPGIPVGALMESLMSAPAKLPEVRQVMFNPPATIVHWSDGTKTVAHCNEQDTFSEEVGLAMACAKKLLHPYENFQECLNKAIRVKGKGGIKKTVKPKEQATKPKVYHSTTQQKIGIDELLRLFANGAPNGAIEATIVLG